MSKSASAIRSSSGIYSTPWDEVGAVTPGTVYDYVLGDLREFKDAAEADTRLSLANYVTGQRWTLQEVREETTILAANLITRNGVKKGDNVLISFPSGPGFFLLALASMRAGLVTALANPTYTPHELKHIAHLVNAKLVLTVAALRKGFVEAGVADDIIIEGAQDAPQSVWKGKVTTLKEANQVLADAGCNSIDWNEPCGIFFSSGTTGLPKAVLISHRNIVYEKRMLQAVPAMNAKSSEIQKMVNYLPAFHVAGFATVLIAMMSGDENHFINKAPIDLPLIVKAIKELKPYRVLMVPPLLMAVVRLGLAGSDGFRNCVGHVLSAAAPLGSAQQEEAYKALGVPIGQLWGMSETTGAATATSPGEKFRPGSCGRVMPGVEVRLIDDAGADVKHGDRGEILVRGAINMLCYYGNASATRETIDKNGWLYTGDIGYMDEDGHLFVVDRRKELIKVKGMQVAPAELEALLLTHSAVMDAGVTGVQDKDGGEVPRAFVVLRPGSEHKEPIYSVDGRGPRIEPSTSAIAQDIFDFVAKHAASYKRLRGGIVMVNEVPKNPSGKILRRVLRELSRTDNAKL